MYQTHGTGIKLKPQMWLPNRLVGFAGWFGLFVGRFNVAPSCVTS